MLVTRVFRALQKQKVGFAVAGGWAVALHGAVRGTVDLDIVIALTERNLTLAEKALNSIELQSRLPITALDVAHFRKEYVENKNMKAWRFVNPSNPTEIVDILLVEDLRKLKLKNIKVGTRSIHIVAIPDLIRMKKKARRPQDLEDIKALEGLKK